MSGAEDKGMRYKDIVDYDKLDPFKEAAMKRFASTFRNLERWGFRLNEESVGETAAVIETPADFDLAFGVEGLGTKNMVAELMSMVVRQYRSLFMERGIGVRRLFSTIGQCNMAMSANDLASIGAILLAYEPIIATGDSGYFDDPDVREGLIDGFENAARIAGVAIPGGETPTLKGIVAASTIDMAGGSLGIIRPKDRLVLGKNLEPGLVIYGISSSGIHANGLSLARKIAEKLPDGYFTKLPSGKTFGEALLKPTVIYAPLVEALFDEGVDVRYMQPITGHGWAKMMRKKRPLRYAIDSVPEPQEEFRFMQEAGPVSEEELYKTFNMGVGWVVYAPKYDSGRIGRACQRCGLTSYEMGQVEAGEREVVISPINVTYRPEKAV